MSSPVDADALSLVEVRLGILVRDALGVAGPHKPRDHTRGVSVRRQGLYWLGRVVLG